MSEEVKCLMVQINNLPNYTEKEIKQTLENLKKIIAGKQQIKLIYDGPNFCQLSGKILGNEKYITLTINDQNYRILNAELKELVKKYCFWENIFEWSFSTIYNVQLFSDDQNGKPKQVHIEITENILKEIYDEKEYQNLQENIKKFYDESEYYFECLQKDIYFECPKTKKKYQTLFEGINIQGRLYSIEGALMIYKEDKDKLFDHQIQFLENYQRLKI